MGAIASPTPAATIKIPGGGGRPGPINLNASTPGPKRLAPGTVNPAPPAPNTTGGRQPANPVVNSDTPIGKNTGTAKAIQTKLRAYTKNGWGTPSTNLSGEFPAQLATSAMVNPASNNFSLQWSRTQSGKEEKGNLYITRAGQSVWLGAKAVKMPAGSTSVDIPYAIPNLAPNAYELLIAGESANSNRVKVNFGGTGAESAVDLPKTASGGLIPTKAAGGFTIKFTHFQPMKGTPGPSGTSGYTHPRLIYRITPTVDIDSPTITFEVYSAPFTDSSSLTQSGPASYPSQKLFEKKKKINAKLKANTPVSLYVDLDATSDTNWSLAYGKTDKATFKWSASGQAGGSEQHPLQKKW